VINNHSAYLDFVSEQDVYQTENRSIYKYVTV